LNPELVRLATVATVQLRQVTLKKKEVLK